MWLGDISTTTPVHGVDANPAAARRAQYHIPCATIAELLPKPPRLYDVGFFDFVYSQNHFNNLDAALVDKTETKC